VEVRVDDEQGSPFGGHRQRYGTTRIAHIPVTASFRGSNVQICRTEGKGASAVQGGTEMKVVRLNRLSKIRALPMAAAVLMSGLMHAQTPATTPRAAQPADRLPVKRVVLYKSGVGYFEHLGRVRGNGTVSIDFTSGQLDDVLKSLTTLDLDGGRVSGVSY